jgi:hypothetical protein
LGRNTLPMRVRRNGQKQVIPEALFTKHHFKPPTSGNLRQCIRISKVKIPLPESSRE